MYLGLFGFKSDSYTIKKKKNLWAEINNGGISHINFAQAL